jgi:iron(III) transport system ATP-binding protein
MIAGFVEPTTGRISIAEQPMSDLARGIFIPPERRQIGMVFQSYAVWPHMNILHNVAYPLKIRKVPASTWRQRAEEALELVRLGGLGARYPNQLSGGQQQRVALARALIMKPRVLLLDEPLSNLDAKLREDMRFEIKDLQVNTGVTIIYVTHDQAEAMAMSDRIVVMNQGRVHQIGTPTAIYRYPADQFVADFVGLINLIPCDADPAKGGVVLEDENGTVFYPLVLPETIQSRAVLAVRPENITIEADAAQNGRTGTLRGRIERATYMGNMTDCLVRVGAQKIRVQTDGFCEFRPDDRVCLTVMASSVFAPEGNNVS